MPCFTRWENARCLSGPVERGDIGWHFYRPSSTQSNLEEQKLARYQLVHYVTMVSIMPPKEQYVNLHEFVFIGTKQVRNSSILNRVAEAMNRIFKYAIFGNTGLQNKLEAEAVCRCLVTERSEHQHSGVGRNLICVTRTAKNLVFGSSVKSLKENDGISINADGASELDQSRVVSIRPPENQNTKSRSKGMARYEPGKVSREQKGEI
jgi:hypothetical protein